MTRRPGWAGSACSWTSPRTTARTGSRTSTVIDGDVEAALEQAIADVRGAMAPLTPEEIASERASGVEDPRPLEHDVAITHGGKILAVIQASDDHPIVTRFRTTAPHRPGDLHRVH